MESFSKLGKDTVSNITKIYNKVSSKLNAFRNENSTHFTKIGEGVSGIASNITASTTKFYNEELEPKIKNMKEKAPPYLLTLWDCISYIFKMIKKFIAYYWKKKILFLIWIVFGFFLYYIIKYRKRNK